MLFSEVYGSYFNVVAEIINEAVNGTLTDRKMYEIVNRKAFAESTMNIPFALKSEEWKLITSDLKTPIKHTPTMPLTTLQKRWLKALLDDPRIKLFDVSAKGLEDIEPLYTQDIFEYFDRYNDGDDFENPKYIENFRIILTALKNKNKIVVHFDTRLGQRHRISCIPHRLEYSQKDDKFRLIAVNSRETTIINLSRISFCSLWESYRDYEDREERHRKETLVFELTDKRNALERIMLNFSHLKKKTEKIDDKHYRVSLEYDKSDETEMLIRILSFGPMIKVQSPQGFIELIKNRIEKQKGCGLL